MKKKISFVFPVFNEESTLDAFYKAVADVTSNVRHDCEFIFVVDGATDNSLTILKEIQKKDRRLTILEFSRNFGHQVAITAGMDYAQGDAVVVMDSDLQDPPSVSLELIERWERGVEVAYAQRRVRKDTWFKRNTAHVFYRVLNLLSDVHIPPDTGDFRLMDRRVVEVVKKMREHNRFMRGLSSYVGFRQEAVLYDRDERYAGVTNYTLKKMIRLSIDAFVGFSTVPLRIISNVGFLVSGLSVLGIIYALYMKFFMPEITVSGWTFLTISILFLSGIQMVMLGVIGSYLGRIYDEVRGRPLYIVSHVYNPEEGENGGK
jgi:polyisoprenyl-phosphate glycosyltransferase